MNKKLILAVGVVLVFLGYVAYQKTTATATPPAVQNPETLGSGSSAPLEGTNPNAGNIRGDDEEEGDDDGVSTPGAQIKVSSPGSASTQVQSVAGPYKDGSYTGALVDAFYGPMQVKAVVSGGKLTDVVFLQTPNQPGTTMQKTQNAMPLLKASAIRNQSAKVDAISGSTQTKEGFELSLASALAQAK